jgi:primosomal protein N' (replication factor Y)
MNMNKTPQDKKNPPILQVALPTPLRRRFDYLAPEGVLPEALSLGQRISVPFAGRELVGVIVGFSDHSEVPAHKLKSALAILDQDPLLSDKELAFAEFAARYYHHPIGEVLTHMLPLALRQGKPATYQPLMGLRITATGKEISPESLKRAVKQGRALLLLQAHPEGMSHDALKLAEVSKASLQALQEKGWIEPLILHVPELPDRQAPLVLQDEQAVAFDRIASRLNGYSVTLLQGITGSGKTEVYLQTIDRMLAQKKQVLVLVPEIGLTPQTLARFQARFGVSIGLLHSNIAEGARLQTWLKAQRGELAILIGTRSAVFTPMPHLGLIVIDEEHDLSFKQQEGFRYHARDLAIWRAHQMNIPVILGSATPSLETLHKVHQGKFFREILTQRVQGAKPPVIKLIDLKNQPLEGGLSLTLLKAIESRLARKEQVLLFLNRRGYAPTWMCHTCGWVANCPRCDAHLTYHQQGRLVCHHCDYQIKRLQRCKSCGSESSILLGEGTQRLEEVLQQKFPEAAIARIDRDSTRRKEALSQIIDKINAREFDLLLGTQMLAKGHHFPYVTLVAIVDSDAGLLSTDFRAAERMAQLLTQVSGRAGREHLPGEVIVQTHHPEHPLLQQLLTEGYSAFAESSLQERAAMQLPPHGHLALLRAESVHALFPLQFLQQAREFLSPLSQVRCLGPIPAAMEKRQGKFRAQLLISASQRPPLQQALSQLVQALETTLAPKQVRWTLDIDPQEMQ